MFHFDELNDLKYLMWENSRSKSTLSNLFSTSSEPTEEEIVTSFVHSKRKQELKDQVYTFMEHTDLVHEFATFKITLQYFTKISTQGIVAELAMILYLIYI